MAYRFLVVDDTSFMRKMTADCLLQFGYEVAGEASNGKEAIQLYEELRPDAVLMDLTMPEMSGLDAIKAIIAVNPNAVVLICSASNQKDLILEAMEAGAKGYLLKPFNPNRLQEVIRKYAEPFLSLQTLTDTDHPPIEAQHDSLTSENEAGLEVEEDKDGGEELGSGATNTSYIEEVQESASLHAESVNPVPDRKPVADLNKGDGKLKSFVSSLMCHWQEDQNGVVTDYSVVYTERENRLSIEWRDPDDRKQAIPFTLDGFRQLAGWLEDHLKARQG